MTDLGAAAPVMGERVPQGIVFEEIQTCCFGLTTHLSGEGC